METTAASEIEKKKPVVVYAARTVEAPLPVDGFIRPGLRVLLGVWLRRWRLCGRRLLAVRVVVSPIRGVVRRVWALGAGGDVFIAAGIRSESGSGFRWRPVNALVALRVCWGAFP